MVRRRLARREIVLGAAAALTALFVLTLYLWHLTENVRLGYAVTEARGLIETLHKDIRKLESERAALLSPERVERIARQSLGLAEPRPDQIIYEER